MPSPLVRRWKLDPGITFLNHGSYGAAPIAVLERQADIRERLELQPVQFLGRELEGELDAARAEVAAFVDTSPTNIAFVTNATEGVNTVLRSLTFAPGDELLVTDHAYNACRNALNFVAERAGASVVVAEVPFPIESADDVVDAIVSCVTPRTRIALIDHITSPTALVFPIARIVQELRSRGVDTLVDGAHALGMVELSMDELGATYYASNGHKWLCSPKGSAFLYVEPERQEQIRPLTISHGANRPREDKSRFMVEFGWTGTRDPSAWLSMPAAIEVMAAMVPGEWDEVRRRNRELALAGRRVVQDVLGVVPACPDDMIGSIASIPLGLAGPPGPDPLQARLWERYRIEVPVMRLGGQRVVRVSAQLYNEIEDYERLAEALREELRAS